MLPGSKAPRPFRAAPPAARYSWPALHVGSLVSRTKRLAASLLAGEDEPPPPSPLEKLRARVAAGV